MNGNWDGRERRANSRDHDLLTRMDANISNFMQRYAEHVEDDRRNFDKIFPKISKLEKFMWGVMGAFILIEIVFSIYRR